MPVFAYIAIDPSQRELCGTLTSETPAEGRQRLREQGFRIVAFTQAATRRNWSLRLGSRARRREQVAELCRYLALLLRAGVPLAECLDVLTQREAGRLTAVLRDVRERIAAGVSFADALAVHDGWFEPLLVSAVRVGELTGSLEECLTDLAEHLRADQALRARLTGAMIYPLILVVVGAAVVIFLMSYVVPQLVTVLAASGRALPWSTALLKSGSDALVTWWPLLLGAVVMLGAAAALTVRRPGPRRALQRGLLVAPLLGPLLRRTLIAGFAQRMAILLKTGVPFVDAMRTVGRLSRYEVLADELALIATAVESGSDIAPAMQGSRVFPAVVVHLMAVGQDGGELTELLAELKVRYETEVRIAVDRFTAAIEPLLIILLAAAVGFVVFACLMPILEATRAIA